MNFISREQVIEILKRRGDADIQREVENLFSFPAPNPDGKGGRNVMGQTEDEFWEAADRVAGASRNEWHRWFAWHPVEVDAYEVGEIRDGEFSYRVCCRWVERRWVELRSDDEGTEWKGWKYRLPRSLAPLPTHRDGLSG